MLEYDLAPARAVRDTLSVVRGAVDAHAEEMRGYSMLGKYLVCPECTQRGEAEPAPFLPGESTGGGLLWRQMSRCPGVMVRGPEGIAGGAKNFEPGLAYRRSTFSGRRVGS